MAEYDNTNRGSIWKNEKKTTDAHPDFTGELNVAGMEFWVSAWKRKEGEKPNAPALSFSIKMKEPKVGGQPARPAIQQNDPEEFDDIPFN